MHGHLGLTAFATLLCGASALVTSSPGAARWLVPRRASRVVAPVAARFECDEPAKKPSFMLHSCVAEPKDVASVPAAAAFLSTEFPDEPFVLQHRTDTGYLAAQEGAPVLDLSDLKEIVIADDGNSLKCAAGITVADVVKTLSNLSPGQKKLDELFSVLPSNSKLPVVQAVLDAAVDPESRGREYRGLAKAVQALHVVGKDGAITRKLLDDFNQDTDIVVNVILAAPMGTSKPVLARWYSRLPTAPPITERIITDLTDDTHVMIFKYGMFNRDPTVVIFVDGDRELNLVQDEWKVSVARTPAEFWQRRNEWFEAACFEVLTASAELVIPEDQAAPSIAEVLEVFPARDEHLLVQINKGSIVAKFDADHPPEVDEATRSLFTEQKTGSKKVALAGRPMARKTGWTSPVEATPILPKVDIPGFSGEIYDRTSGNLEVYRQQYATSSYDTQMNPSIIAYPRTAQDVALAIEYASSDKFAEARETTTWPSGYPLKVMGRGGGHQYCGTSCDNDALILSMDHFNTIKEKEVNLNDVTGPDGTPHTVTKEFHVGTGIILKKLATEFNNSGVTVPHGECPTVGIGGHSQTGGAGHIARNFGFCIDYVYGFTIVTADGEIREVNRDSDDEKDQELYWAVLGGSPGAFGVTTNLVFHPILNEDYPHSTAWDATFPYSAQRMKACLDILEDAINRAQESDDDALADGLDMMMTLASKPTNRLTKKPIDDSAPMTGAGIDEAEEAARLDPEKDSLASRAHIVPSMVTVELECKDMQDAKAYGQMQDIIEKFTKTVYDPSNPPFPQQLFNVVKDGKTHYPLSELSLYFTRKPPGVTSTGRENRRAYNKACYGSKDKLAPGWSEDFAKLLDDVVHTTSDVHCIFQSLPGGGAMMRNGKANLNAMSHRDAHCHGIVFDLFRGDDDQSIKDAADFQRRFEMEVVNKHMTAYPKVMQQWASHGDLDMNKKQVWEKYIDNEAKYNKLRRIKKEVDPDDVFHARFTIRPEVEVKAEAEEKVKADAEAEVKAREAEVKA